MTCKLSMMTRSPGCPNVFEDAQLLLDEFDEGLDSSPRLAVLCLNTRRGIGQIQRDLPGNRMRQQHGMPDIGWEFVRSSPLEITDL